MLGYGLGHLQCQLIAHSSKLIADAQKTKSIRFLSSIRNLKSKIRNRENPKSAIPNPKSIFVFIHMNITLGKRDTDAFGIKLLFHLLGGVKIK